MKQLLLLGVVSFATSYLLTPLVRNVFRKRGLVDEPDLTRKRHDRAVPRVGGIAIAASFVLAYITLLLVRGPGSLVEDGVPFATRLLPAAAMIFAVGLFDDLVGLKPWQKLGGQFVAALMAYWAGIEVQGFAGQTFPEWTALPLTVFWLILCTNAMNLIDGVDGLAAGVGLFATTTMLLAALLQGNLALAVATVPMVGCLIGFLRYNFNPATIFLGDSGSLFIGFLLGCYGVLWSQKSATILGMTAPLIALSVPLIDTALAVTRRFLRSKSIFSADRGHIHHRLLDSGLTPRKVALVFYGLCATAAIFSLSLASQEWEGLVIVLFCCVAGACIYRLGYIEFGVAGRMVRQGAFRRHISSQIALKHYEELLVSADTPEECWVVIEQACREFGFQRVRARLAGRMFEYDDDLKIALCNIHVPISDFDAIHLSRVFESPEHSSIIAPLSDMLHRTLAAKVSSFPGQKEQRYRLVSRTIG